MVLLGICVKEFFSFFVEMQTLGRSRTMGVTGGRGTAGAGPGRDLLYYGLIMKCIRRSGRFDIHSLGHVSNSVIKAGAHTRARQWPW